MMLGMRTVRALAILLMAFGLAGTAGTDAFARSGSNSKTVLSMTLNGVVDPFEASYLKDGIESANRDRDAAVLITIDTPGGLDSSMRKIVKAILASKIPVICYTAPSGARAASAGTFVMLACPINAMAPGTNIGAAHPVGVSGAIEQGKVTNDAAAFIQSLAEKSGRNAAWAVQAVRQSVSISAEQALALHVTDYVDPDVRSLFNEVGDCGNPQPSARSSAVTHQAPSVCGATLAKRNLGAGWSILHGLIDPNLAYLFFYLGLILIVIELLHPGLSIPAVFGTLMLVTAFVSFGFLPVQIGGIVLLMASALFYLLELKHPGLGLPTIGGTLALILGGLFLFNRDVPNAGVSPWLILVMAGLLVVFFAFVVQAALRARHMQVVTGQETLIGQIGVALSDLTPRGQVRAGKETWSAVSQSGRIQSGTSVRVVHVSGVRLIVEPSDTPSTQGELAGQQAGPEGGST
jgi:membrane-bound serine protease (ClpP class)